MGSNLTMRALKRNTVSMLSRHRNASLLISLLLALSACHQTRPANETTPVARGLRFVSHNPAFDMFFADLHEEQLSMLQLPEDERKVRKNLAQDLKIADNTATAMVLSERAKAIAQAVLAQGTALKLDIEGINAVDEADTSAQMRVSGNLDGENLRFAEAITRAARAELKLLAHLNAKEQTLQRLAARASILEAETDRTFASDSKIEEAVHRNLSDARILIAIMDERRFDLAVDARRTVERLSSGVTTNPNLGLSNEPPLVTFVRPEPPKEHAPVRAKSGGGAAAPARGAASKSPPEASGQDFEP